MLAAAARWVCGIGSSSVPRVGRAADAIVNPAVLILQFISGVFFQDDRRLTWMRQVASVFPLKWIAERMRSAFLPASAVTSRSAVPGA